jgi:hypothetical protein
MKLTTSHAFRGSELNLHNASKKAKSAFDGRSNRYPLEWFLTFLTNPADVTSDDLRTSNR